ncbi:MAG: flagellin [Myxococcota bacterium]
MAFRIGSSQSSTTLFAQRQFSIHNARKNQALERLASGRRLNSAADGPAEFAISLRLKAQIGSLSQARRNSYDGLSTAQIGEGSLNETSGILVRIRELAIQSANGTLSDQQRQSIGAEAESLLEEVDRIAEVTQFGSKRLLVGLTSIGIATGASADEILNLPSVDARRDALGLSGVDLGTDPQTSASTLASLDAAIDQVSSARGAFGTASNILESRIRQSFTEEEALRAAESRIGDADIAEEAAELAKAQIMEQASLSVLAQSIEQDKIVLDLLEATAS